MKKGSQGKRKSLVDRFYGCWIVQENGCWNWTKSKDSHGYGRIYKGGGGSREFLLVHRLSWLLFNGPISDDLCVLHKCDNPACVNPEHLFLGTHKDNMQDRDKKGRQLKKLTNQQREEVKNLALIDTMTQAEIARIYGVSQQTISNIVRNTL